MHRGSAEVCYRCGAWFQDWATLARHRKSAHGLGGDGGGSEGRSGPQPQPRKPTIQPLMGAGATATPRMQTANASALYRIRPTTVVGTSAEPVRRMTTTAMSVSTRGTRPAVDLAQAGTPAPSRPVPGPVATMAACPPAILHDLSARRERLETMVEVACRWSRKFAIRQVEEMLAATFPEIEADFRKAVAFGVARGTQPTSTTLPSSTTSTSPPQRTAGPPAPVNPTSGGDADPRHYPEAGRGIFLDTPLASGDAMIGEDELLHLLGDWGETVAGISAAYEDITPPGEADVGENGGAD